MRAPWPEQLLTFLASVRPYWALIVLMLTGLSLWAISASLGIDQVTSTVGDREVGYLVSWHWSINYAAVFPVTAYLMLSAFQQMREALGELHRRGMIRRRGTMERADPASPDANLTAVTPQLRRLAALALVLGFSIAAVEVTTSNVIPLLSTGPFVPTNTTDWGEGYFLLLPNSPSWLRYANLLFDVAAFTLEGVALSAGFLFLFYFLELASRLRELHSQPDLVLVPDVTDPDKRRGFNVFERPVQLMLYSSLGMFVMCYLSRIMKMYFAQVESKTPWDFIAADLAKAPGLSLANTVPSLTYWLSPGDTSTLMGIVVASAGFVLVLFVTITIIDLLRGAARQSRDDLARWVEGGRPLFDVPASIDARGALTSIESWPVAYPSVREFWALVVVASVAMVSYRLVLLVAILGLTAAFKKVRRMFAESKPTPQTTAAG